MAAFCAHSSAFRRHLRTASPRKFDITLKSTPVNALTSLEDFRSLRAIPDTAIRPFHIFANHFFQDIEVARGGAEIAKFPIYGFWGNWDKAEAIQFDSPVSADI